MRNKSLTALFTAVAATLVFGAAALAQTPGPTPSATGSPGATTTAGSTMTSTVAVTTTAAVSPTAGQATVFVPTVSVPNTVYQPGGTGDFAFADPAFQNVWDRTDHPVQLGQVSRTWFWGPGPNTGGLFEQYNESPTGNRQRLVQYFDKSRMELNNPGGDRNSAFFVTNGLLSVELISGFIQVGETDFTRYRAACIPMSGDFGDTLAPTYRAFQGVSNTQAGDHPAQNRVGQKVTETIDRNGTTGQDASKGNVPGVELAYFEPQTKHNVPRVFWDFLNSSGPTHDANHAVTNQQLISPWFFASGLPISEPYWARATISGTVKDVMIQAYERRALTHVPTNQPGFQVEMANIGQHYFDWRYRNAGVCAGDVIGTPTAPVPVPSGTVVSGTTTPTVARTTTPEPTSCPNCPTATPTITIRVPPGSVVPATQVTASPTAKAATATSTVGPITP